MKREIAKIRKIKTLDGQLEEIKINKNLKTLDWYEALCEQIRATAVVTRYDSNLRLLEGKWLVGQLLYENELRAQRAGYGDEFVKTLATDMNMSAQGLWKCMQFYKKFPKADFQTTLDSLNRQKLKSLTWFEVCKSVLPNTHREAPKAVKETCEHKEMVCAKCKQKFNLGQIKEMLSEQM